MRAPQPRGEPIDLDRMRDWVTEFSGYRINVTEERIDRWLSQFEAADRDAAARVLDSVLYVSHSQSAAAFRELLASLNGWSLDADARSGKWVFVPFSGSAGKSGDEMLTLFRRANNMSAKKYDSLFAHPSELVKLNPGDGDTVVLIDDFSGTGDQALDSWNRVFQELLYRHPRVILALIAASESAILRIGAETAMDPVVHIHLGTRDNIFSDDCEYFDDDEKETLMGYCKRADPKKPKGHGECGFVITFSHTCPNNSIPILHARRRRSWEGLFRRYD